MDYEKGLWHRIKSSRFYPPFISDYVEWKGWKTCLTIVVCFNALFNVKQDQTLKFTNYFLNRISVQTKKGVSDLLSVLELLSSNKYQIPVCVTLYGPNGKNTGPAVNLDKPVLSLRITNSLGKSVQTTNGLISVEAESNGLWGAQKKSFQPVTGDSTLFALNIIESKPKRGRYPLNLSIKSSAADSKLIGVKSILMDVLIQSDVVIGSSQVGIGDRETSNSQLAMTQLKFPSKLPHALEVDYSQKLLLKMSLKDKQNPEDEKVIAHQVFVQFVSRETKREIIFVAEPEDVDQKAVIYKFDLNLNSRSKEFSSASGSYEMNVIIGDVLISNPFTWNLVTVNLKFPTPVFKSPEAGEWFGATWTKVHYGPKPEIKHLFREAEKRPSQFVSDMFSFLVTVPPVILLLIIWTRIGINFGRIQLSIPFLLFHSSLAGIFFLYFMFWLRMDMFTTVKCLTGLGVVAFISGSSLLSKLSTVH